MNIFNKVTVESLKKNRTRTIVTIIGIMLSTALICAVTTSVSSVFHFATDYIAYSIGDWHGSAESVDAETYKMIISSDKVENAVYGQQIGFADIGSDNEYKPYLFIFGVDEGFMETMPVHLISGELPKNSSEILIPEHLAENGGVYYKIGDVITLDIGDRTNGEFKINYGNPNYSYRWTDGSAIVNDETIEVRETRTFTVVGFYSRPDFEPYEFAGYTALTASDGLTDDYAYNVYFSMKKPKDVYAFMDENELYGTTNSDMLAAMGVSRYSNVNTMIYGLAAIVVGLIMFGSISLIYNAFSISVSERTKQFGLLASIGGTKKQLRKMVKFEAFAVSIIGIPLGILLGVVGIGITFVCIGNNFTAFTGYDMPMRLHVSAASIVIACIIAFMTVSISAWIPSKRATKVTAVEAIRQSADIKSEKRPIKTPKIIYKLFGLSGMLAQKHFKRSRKKYRATIFSLFMSVVLFISASAFTSYLVNEMTAGFQTINYDVQYSANVSAIENAAGMTADELLEKIQENEYVTAASYRYAAYLDIIDIPTKYLIDETADLLSKCNYDDSRSPFWMNIYFINDSEYKTLLADNHLSESEFMNKDNPMGLFCNESLTFDPEQGKFTKIKMLKSDSAEIRGLSQQIFGETLSFLRIDSDGNAVYHDGMRETETEELADIKYPMEEAFEEHTFKVGKIINDRPYYTRADSPCIIYPISLYKEVMQQEVDNLFLEYCIKSNDPAACYTDLKAFISKNSLSTSDLHNYASYEDSDRNLIIIVKVFAYGFIVLISLIAAANVFNTVSTNINLRRREFAMLRSVGMTSKDMRKMLNFECILYGTKALLYGLPVSAFVTYLIFLAINNGFEADFYMPWGAVGIAVLSVFAVVFSTMMYSMSKIKKDNPIDALKNENI